MNTPILDMEVAFWAFLAGKASYLALALKEFRGYDGNVLPFDPKGGLFPEVALPAIAMEISKQEKALSGLGDKDVGTSPCGYKLVADAEGSIVYPANDVYGRGRQAVENAAHTIRLLLDSREAHQTRLGAPTKIEHYIFDLEEVHPWSPVMKGSVAFWEQRFKLTLQSNRVQLP